MATQCRRQQKWYLSIHVKCPVFLPNFKQFWIFLTDIHRSPALIYAGRRTGGKTEDGRTED